MNKHKKMEKSNSLSEISVKSNSDEIIPESICEHVNLTSGYINNCSVCRDYQIDKKCDIENQLDNISNKVDGMSDDYIGEIKSQMEKIKTQSKIDVGLSKKDVLTKRIKDLKIPS